MVYRALAVSALISVAAATPEGGAANIVKSIFQLSDVLFDRHEEQYHSRMTATSSGPAFLSRVVTNNRHRHLEDESQENCDSAFLKCLPEFKCVDCFATLELQGIDWTGVTPDTPCTDVVAFLIDGGHCDKLKDEQDATDIFCNTFNACVVWEDDGDDPEDDDMPAEQDENWVNCTALTECDWEGMKKNWIGDGVCQDNMHGCYNTALCDWDGGDCCEDTCEDGDSEYKNCGHDGFACRNPKSDNCDSDYTQKCPANSGKNSIPDPSSVTCAADEQKYRLMMYDSFGDGWDTTMLTLTPSEAKQTTVFKGQLENGSQGTEYICLSKSPTCYHVATGGGSWGVEVSWEIKPMAEGSPTIAGGGAPGDCDFPAAGAQCEKTCDGRPDTDPTKDKDYNSFEDLYTCISEKCVIQLGACTNDETCEKCFAEDAPEYCYGVDTFVAVIDCTMCSCTDKKGTDYCENRKAPADKKDEDSAPQRCNGAQTMKGAKAVLDYSNCANMDEIGVMITDFDQSNFGQLDQFETCAHSFNDEENHGGHTALGCMQILYNAMTNPTVKENSDAPLEAISALATDLYQNGESFCDCTKQASDDCPLCPSFMSFKTLLYESLDACESLDQIDCDAWSEFWKPCKDNMEVEFDGKSDFKSQEQCEYTKKGCGGVGAFPAFRRLDCDKEIDSDAWNFYKSFAKNCLKGDDGIPPDTVPVATPTKAPVKPPVKPSDNNKPSNSDSSVTSPTPKPYVPSDGSNAKPYVPSDEKQATQPKKKSHWFRNLLILCALGGGGYYLYKERFDSSFNFMQYRRARTYDYSMDGGSNSMYSNLNSSTTFEPPSLPPTPVMMGTEMT